MAAPDVITGPVCRPVNSAAGVAGSIHDDDTARKAGFRGGTVAASIHVDQFPPLLVEAFGPQWFETGSLSLYFRHATVDREPVVASCGRPASAGDAQVGAWMHTADGTLVAEGTASLGRPGAPTALGERDLRGGDPAALSILRLAPGDSFEGRHRLDGARQRARLDEGRHTAPLDWYADESPWGGAVASPQTVVDLFSAAGATGFGERLGTAVAMYGALEVRHLHGPLLLDREYTVRGEVVAVGESPKTEFLWWDGVAGDGERDIVSMRMMTRALKGS